MTCTATRFEHNPIFRPENIPPSIPGVKVECVLNPGAFRYRDRVGLLLRVAERPLCDDKHVATLVVDEKTGRVKPWLVSKQDPLFRQVDPRGFFYNEKVFLTTMSHLLIAWSYDDGKNFNLDPAARIFPKGPAERFGIEDCRVEEIEGVYHLTYTAVGDSAVAVGHMTTTDWNHFSPREIMLPPPNKDCALFPRKINGLYYCLHRPSSPGPGNIGDNNMWIAASPDLRYWGNQREFAAIRPNRWDEQRIGAGASPVETEYGWLEIYHGADRNGRYCLGAILSDLDEPWKVLARSTAPIVAPTAAYEMKGFCGACIFTNGQIVDGDRITIYYGAADLIVGGATLSLREILNSLRNPSACPKTLELVAVNC